MHGSARRGALQLRRCRATCPPSHAVPWGEPTRSAGLGQSELAQAPDVSSRRENSFAQLIDALARRANAAVNTAVDAQGSPRSHDSNGPAQKSSGVRAAALDPPAESGREFDSGAHDRVSSLAGAGRRASRRSFLAQWRSCSPLRLLVRGSGSGLGATCAPGPRAGRDRYQEEAGCVVAVVSA
jgi:hypothetical protein